MIGENYGQELILDMHNCDPNTFTRSSLEEYFKIICDLIHMERCKLVWWDDHGVKEHEKQTEPHLKGTSAVQFILTSSIVIHTLDLMERVYLNIFSCKKFDEILVKKFSEDWFHGNTVNMQIVERK